MVGVFFRLVGRELTLAVRGGISSLMAVVFFVLAVTLFPLGIGRSSACSAELRRALFGSPPCSRLSYPWIVYSSPTMRTAASSS